MDSNIHMKWYSHPDASFKRVGGRIEPVCRSGVPKGTIVFYEIPARSTTHITIDIVRYTMQCVCSGEVLFPCAFNTDVEKKTKENITSKVFFDYVFTEEYKRKTMDTLALSFMKTCRFPFIYKALGGFSESDLDNNCQQVTFINGETFLYTTRDVEREEPLRKSPGYITAPHPDDSNDKKFEALFKVNMSDADTLSVAMGLTPSALKVRPEGEVYTIPTGVYPGVEEKIRRYGIERKAGLVGIRERATDIRQGLGEESTEDFLKRAEEKFDQLMRDTKM